MFRIILISLATGSIALMVLDGPRGRVLVPSADKGPVARQPGHRQGGGSIRGPGPGFYIFTGGYHGGK